MPNIEQLEFKSDIDIFIAAFEQGIIRRNEIKVLLGNKAISPKILEYFIKGEDTKLIKIAVSNEIIGELDEELILALIRNERVGNKTSHPILSILASNKNVSENILRKLFELNNKGINYALAGNENTPADILKHFSESRLEVEVAKNPSTSIDILKKLSESENDYVIYALSENPNYPGNELEKIYREATTGGLFKLELGERLSKRRDLSDSFYRELAKSEDIKALEALCINPSLSEDLIKELFESNIFLIFLLLHNSNFPIELLEKLSKDELEVREVVAFNINTPKEILIKLAGDEGPKVRAAVAGNINTPEDILRELVKDENEYVRIKAIKNPNTPDDVIENEENGFDFKVLLERKRLPRAILLSMIEYGLYFEEIFGREDLDEELIGKMTERAIDIEIDRKEREELELEKQIDGVRDEITALLELKSK